MSTTPLFPYTVGDVVTRARLNADLTREELAVAMKVGYRSICNWETDIYVPRGKNLARLAEVTKAPWLVEAINSARTRSRCFATYAGQAIPAQAA